MLLSNFSKLLKREGKGYRKLEWIIWICFYAAINKEVQLNQSVIICFFFPFCFTDEKIVITEWPRDGWLYLDSSSQFTRERIRRMDFSFHSNIETITNTKKVVPVRYGVFFSKIQLSWVNWILNFYNSVKMN